MILFKKNFWDKVYRDPLGYEQVLGVRGTTKAWSKEELDSATDFQILQEVSQVWSVSGIVSDHGLEISFTPDQDDRSIDLYRSLILIGSLGQPLFILGIPRIHLGTREIIRVDPWEPLGQVDFPKTNLDNQFLEGPGTHEYIPRESWEFWQNYSRGTDPGKLMQEIWHTID